MKTLIATALASLASMAATGAVAQLQTTPELTLLAANRLADAAVSACAAKGGRVAVSVVDRGGNLVSLQRADGVGPHNVEASRRKAYTALSTKTATLALSEAARVNPDAANLATLPELLLLGGGVPLRAGTEVVGAIGVAGSGARQDQACAAAALAAVPELAPPDR